MKIAEAKRILEEFNPEDKIMIQFFIKDHVEEFIGAIEPVEWDRMVEIFDQFPPDNEAFGFYDLLDQARERIKKEAKGDK
jgi:hypothetical protein